jgi:hypothetical protein
LSIGRGQRAHERAGHVAGRALDGVRDAADLLEVAGGMGGAEVRA